MTRRFRAVAAVVLMLAASPAFASEARGYGLLTPSVQAELPARARTDAARAVLAAADAGLSRPPAPLPVVHTEGTLPGKGIREISLVARRDLPQMLDFALAYRVTGQPRYRDAAARYLEAWLDVYRISLNPIDETHFDQLIATYDLTERDLTPPLRAKADAFLRAMATGYLDAMEAQSPPAVTNWQSHRIKIATLAAYQLDDPALIERARSAYRAHVSRTVAADATVHDFHERDAIHYVTYSLEPLMIAALAAKRHGEDWYGWTNPSGTGVAAALDWLAPYARGEKTHQEFVRSTVRFDAERAAVGQSGFSGLWDPAKAVPTYTLAAALDPRWRALRDALVARHGREAAPRVRLMVKTGEDVRP